MEVGSRFALPPRTDAHVLPRADSLRRRSTRRLGPRDTISASRLAEAMTNSSRAGLSRRRIRRMELPLPPSGEHRRRMDLSANSRSVFGHHRSQFHHNHENAERRAARLGDDGGHAFVGSDGLTYQLALVHLDTALSVNDIDSA